MINGANVCIVKCGLGGGTGSGAAPVICKLAKETGALIIAVVAEPFPFEGKRRMKQDVEAIDLPFEGVDAVKPLRASENTTRDTPPSTRHSFKCTETG